MNAPVYTEAGSSSTPRQLALSHVSIEVGHFYMEDLLNGADRIRTQFRRVARRVAAEEAIQCDELEVVRPRISTCFLVDDYFRRGSDPSEILPKLLDIADECGIRIDYLAREAGCSEAEGVPLAEITAAKLLPEPPPGTTGGRPPVQKSGWICNGERSPVPAIRQAMMPVKPYKFPTEFGRREHTIFSDIEMWRDKDDGERLWSCPFLAAVWQLLRLGALRHEGEPAVVPRRKPAKWPSHWQDLPAVIQLNDTAQPFAAYRTMSILPRTYLKIENAVEVILNHLDVDEDVVRQTTDRAAAEGIRLPAQVADRVAHTFFEWESLVS